MSDVDDLRAEYAIAQSHERGTDMTRIEKQLAALGATPKPARTARAEAAASRADAAGGEPSARAKPPEGRTSPRGRQTKTS